MGSDILDAEEPGAMSAKAYHHGNLREALVDAARQVITEGGVSSVSLRKVAREAGVSQAAPYHHFENKEGLLAEVARRGFVELVARMDQVHEDDPVAYLLAMGHTYVAFGLEQPAVYGLMFGSEFCPAEDHVALKEAAMRALSQHFAAVHRGQVAGVFDGDDPMGPSLAVWSAMHGLVSLLHARMHDGKEMVGGVVLRQADMIDATMALVLKGLGVSG